MAGDDAERQHDSNNENFDGTFFGWFGLDGALSRSLSDGTFRMKKGRALNAPPSVAPLSARPENTPSRALGARARGRSLDKKLAVFRRDRSRSYAKLLVNFRFVQFLIFLLLPRILPPGAVHWQGCVIASNMARVARHGGAVGAGVSHRSRSPGRASAPDISGGRKRFPRKN